MAVEEQAASDTPCDCRRSPTASLAARWTATVGDVNHAKAALGERGYKMGGLMPFAR